MSMLAKSWRIAPPVDPEIKRQFRGINPIVTQILVNRGLDDPRTAEAFLYGKRVVHSPFDMADMEQAVGRIRNAIQRSEPIVVYGDFDADGVTSTTLLVQALQAMNANVRPYIPNRAEEGYGLNIPALEEMAAAGVRLIVTVDCGIRSIEEIQVGKAAGLDIIVTDHHSLGHELPQADAVINCKREGYPEDMLAGVGVAFKLVQALMMAEQRNGRKNGRDRNRIGSGQLRIEDLSDLVALGTIADLMPLDRLENRTFVRRGLEVLNKAERPGIRALLDVAGIKPGEITATTVGYVLGPRINAAGRLDDAMIAYRLLSSRSLTEARKWAEKLQELNTERQAITREAHERVREQLVDDDLPLIFAGHDSFQPGIVGLVAGRLTEEFFRPAIVMEHGKTESRASCRSIPQFDITHALDECADLLVRHGGHALAAGFTVINENIDALRERLTTLAQSTLDGQQLKPTLEIDAELDIHTLTENLVNDLAMLEPCGSGNPAPVLMVRNAHVAEYRTVGRDNRHLKLKISRASQPPLDAIGFGLGDWVHDMPERIDMAFTLEINDWNGRQYLQANLQDIRPAEEPHPTRS